MDRIVAVKVFTATRAADRESLGGKLSAWLDARPDLEVVRALVRQSSDASFHCLSIIVFCRTRAT
jgi:hypothetical protein